MKNKINVGLVFGGQSFEHRVSLLSAKSVLDEIDREKYAIRLFGIDRNGAWHSYTEGSHFLKPDDPERIALGEPSGPADPFQWSKEGAIDVVFPLLHGPNGEDGSVQGVLQLLGLPFVGSGILGSAIGMDKEVTKCLLRQQSIPIVDFQCILEEERGDWTFERVSSKLGTPLFVKPSCGGSSLGIHLAGNRQEFEKALEEAFRFDRKVLVERAVFGKEIQVALMGNAKPIVSKSCQIEPKGRFHTYESKYLNPQGAVFTTPAPLSEEAEKRVQALALKTYQSLHCEGFARVDFFLEGEEFFVSEINTIPGLTQLSPFAKMWQAGGVSYTEMIDRLINYAFERQKKEAKRCRYPEEIKIAYV